LEKVVFGQNLDSINQKRMIDMKDSHLFDTQESKWVELAQKNDLDAFNHLVLSYQDAVFSLASWMVNDDVLAEDIAQTAFLAAYRNIRQFHGGSFRAWLLQITRNSCIDELRRRNRHPWQPLEPTNAVDQPLENADWLVDRGPSPEELVIQREEQRKVERSIQQLADPFREVLILIDIEAYGYQEAATVLNAPLGTIKSRLVRARAYLRALLDEGLSHSVVSESSFIFADSVSREKTHSASSARCDQNLSIG
jgi:RNA polymerase sigma factor (sigma-70 family)